MPTSILPAAALLLALSWALPACAATYFVSGEDPAAADANSGTEAQPLRTINAAVDRAEPGDTILVKNGTYRESVEREKEDWKDPARRITLSAYPGHRPIIKGSEIVAGPWERLEGDRPIYACAREPYTEMVFVDEAPLRQIGLQGNPKRYERNTGFKFKRRWVGKGLEDLEAGTFFYDPEAKRLNVWLADGSDPAGHVVEAAVLDQGIGLKGTWTLSGLDVRHFQDGIWPREQAVVISGNQSVVEHCRIAHNGFLGLIVSGEDCIIRGNEIAHNALMGFTSNWGYRMLVEGNELHHNAWRGDVECLTAGNKFVMWRDSQFLRNWWHDEDNCALWLDISDANVLIAENRFDRCTVGVYFEISRWAVIVNNVLRDCGRAIWSYSSDVLIAHNVLDRCGEGITVSGYPRHCNENQSVREPSREALMATHNNLIVNNILVDCPGAFIGITPDTAFGAGNYSDYNVFAWTLPAYHQTGNHINFMGTWHQIYARLPEWRLQRHYDTHSVVCDPGLLERLRGGSPFVVLAPHDVVADAGFAGREAGNYELAPDSPLRGRGVSLPLVLNGGYQPGPGTEIASRAFARTLLADAPDPEQAVAVYGGETKHYRLQPLPALRRLVDLDAQPPGTPGLNPVWRQTGRYPAFDATRPPDAAGDLDWTVFPDNRLADPSFDLPMARAGEEGEGPWVTRGVLHTWSGVACANLLPTHQQDAIAAQKIGTVPPNCEVILWGDVHVASTDPRFSATARLYLAAGDDLQPLGPPADIQVDPGRTRTWVTALTRFRSGKQGEDAAIGKDLYAVLAARVSGPADAAIADPVAFARWDNLILLSGAPPAR